MVSGSTKQRLFIALYPPLRLVEQLFSEVAVGKSKNCRLVDKNQVHLTLSFLGDVETTSQTDVIEQLRLICKDRQVFNIETLAYRYLPSNKNPRLLALSCRLNHELATLYHQCQTLIIDHGKHQKPFLPHITVCRYKRKLNIKVIADHQPTRFKVSEIKLMRSQLFPDRAVHDCLECFEFNQ